MRPLVTKVTSLQREKNVQHVIMACPFTLKAQTANSYSYLVAFRPNWTCGGHGRGIFWLENLRNCSHEVHVLVNA